jgi:adenylate cyclase
MSDVFISYARASAPQAHAVAEAIRALGYDVWRDDQLPAHRPYADVIEERLHGARAVIVLWSADAAHSQWVRAEASVALDKATLVQLTLDGTMPPLPFNQIQCVDLAGWTGNAANPAFRKIIDSVSELVGRPATGAAPAAPVQPAVQPVLTLPGKPSIAVMPFANLSGDPEEEYFADGMVLEIIEALSRYRSIFVIASASSLSFKGKQVDIDEVARQLGVRYLLEGSVRKAGGRVRIGVQLIDAADKASIWTHRFDDTLEDIFELQDKVALAVAGKIEPALDTAEYRRVAGRSTESMGSYDLFLRGRAVSVSHSKSATFTALDLLHRSIALDPDFGPALVRAAHCHRLVWSNRWSPDPEADKRQCIELANRALRAAEDDATVVTTVAYIRTIAEGDDQGAIRLIERAIALNPGSARVLYWSGRLRLVQGDSERAIADIETSLRLDPLGPLRDVQMFGIGMGRFAQKRFEEAQVLFSQSGLLAKSGFAIAFGAACLGQLGRLEEARALLARYDARDRQPLAEVARTWLHDPAQLELFMEGIDRARAPEVVAG